MKNLISSQDLNTWADYLINYSLDGVTSKDIVMIKGEKICWPLISVIQDKIFAAGATVDINLTSPTMTEVKFGDHQLQGMQILNK